MKQAILLLVFLCFGCDSAPSQRDTSAANQIAAVEALTAPADGASQPDGGESASEKTADKAFETQPLSSASTDVIPLGKLPSTAIPQHYWLEFSIDPNDNSFSGLTKIEIELHQPTDFVYLHGKDLNVRTAHVVVADGERLEATYDQVHSDGVALVRFPKLLNSGRVTLEFAYDAKLGTRLHGLYKVIEEGRAYVFTQMESVYAREAFVSFDEPRFKTPFDLSVVIPKDQKIVANTPIIAEHVIDEKLKRVVFASSKPMTTYLVALAVGPLEIVEAQPIAANSVRSAPLPLRGVAVAGKGKDLEFALAETGAILASLERYFDMAYPYAKLDIIAVPDFEAGAMENIGAITFRESLLLLKTDAPPQQKRAFTSVMAHELAHMWFGDLVTMPWWDDIWLNESFATWMSYKAVSDYDPLQQPEIAQLRRAAYAMKEDGLTSARQIREPVVDNDGIVEAFDGITYAKGGAILSMFERFVGEDKFRDGIRQHMLKFSHGSADVNDLVASISSSAGQDLAPAVNTFLFQNGIPLLDVEPNCNASTVTLNQSRFLPIGSQGDGSREWQIPVCLKYSVNNTPVEQCVLLKDRSQTIELEGQCDGWLLPNANFSGYFHWMLPQSMYAKLTEQADSLNQREWMSIADSAKAGFASGRLDVAEVWPIIEQLAKSNYPNVARSMIPTVRFMDEFLADDPKVRSMLRSRAASLYSPLKAYRAFDESFIKSLKTNEDALHLSNVAGFMAEILNHRETRVYALDKARVYLKHGIVKANVSKASLDTILTVGVQDGGVVFFDQLLERVEKSSDAWFRDTALAALARTKEIQLGERVRALALADTLRSNEIGRVISSHLEERINTWPTWRWIKANYEKIEEKMPKQHLAKLPSIASRMCDTDYAKEVEAFFRPRFDKIAGGTRRLNTALESMQICSASVAQQTAQAKQFLSPGVRR